MNGNKPGPQNRTQTNLEAHPSYCQAFLRQKHRIFFQEYTFGNTEALHACYVEGIILSSGQMMHQLSLSIQRVNTAVAQSKFYFGVLWFMTLSILAGWCQCSCGTYYLCLKYGHSHLKIEVSCSIPNRLLSFTGYLHYRWESLLLAARWQE